MILVLMFFNKLRSSLIESLRRFLVLGENRPAGKLIGTDNFGNRYYEVKNEKFMFPCNK